MNETDFHRHADATLAALYDALEAADRSGALELESEAGALSIKMPSGKAWLLSKHAASKQLWLASPVSGGLHFSYRDGQWALPDGRLLYNILADELALPDIRVP